MSRNRYIFDSLMRYRGKLNYRDNPVVITDKVRCEAHRLNQSVNPPLTLRELDSVVKSVLNYNFNAQRPKPDTVKVFGYFTNIQVRVSKKGNTFILGDFIIMESQEIIRIIAFNLHPDNNLFRGSDGREVEFEIPKKNGDRYIVYVRSNRINE